jgi:hypothetical protein
VREFVLLVEVDPLCMYLGRTGIKYRRNLRFAPLICEGVGVKQRAQYDGKDERGARSGNLRLLRAAPHVRSFETCKSSLGDQR